MRGKRALSAAGLALVALSGFGLGACGGGGGSGALSTGGTRNLTSIAGTVSPSTPTRTRTRTATVGSPTDAATTSVTTTVGETTTTAVTTTVSGPTTTTTHILTATTATTTVPVTVPPTTTGSESSSGTPWPWIILAAALAAAAGLIGFLVWHRRRSGAVAWGSQTADLNRRALVALDDVVAEGSLATGQIEALAAEARGLEGRAPDDVSAAAAAQVRARLDDLTAALESDRALRLGSPAPSQEQLSYSEALIRQQLEQLQGVLRPPSPPQASD